ncbi:3-oxoacyl-ACP reductase FabG [Ureibacillus chungkukjangi]|uniref:3-oxoacyl-[acyl-carrier-protein] reductase n=1 Tax=Ureibacillus chungkukjangi TaxID=1202712 RepID=A0A318U5V0_9BACL|nr:3-oxoacyl-ACP reductase FabG [Ureibacillus chungkukjangi]PYF07299.1 3-oxoacyl-[acyl-carrier-protein] reductase [Ureibacillus chungkukjangi]
MTQRFDNRVAFITGGSRGIGKGIAETFAEEGAKIAIIDINEEALQEVEAEFKEKGINILAIQANVVKAAEVEAAMEQVVKEFGSIDILVNNAGIIRDNLLFKMTDSDWDQVIDVHLKGAFNTTRAAQKYMVQQKYGRIINISSTSALGNPGQANYSAVKAGLQGLTKTLAKELGKFGITSNSVAPGFIETDMTKATAERIGVSFEDFLKGVASKIPVGRAGKPSDIANAVAFFADEKSSFVNGQVIYVAGGPTN